jgi:hypothetical protein
MSRFSIRDLFWATLVVAMGLGWGLHWRSIDANRQAAVQHAERLHGELAAAKECCEDLEKNVEYALEWRKKSVKPDFSLKSRIVDWTVLDEPIPGLITN